MYKFSREMKLRGPMVGLAGCTEEPCWEGLRVGPEQFIKQDLLHGSHKFVWDHLAKWIALTMGEAELDHQYMAQLPKQLTTIQLFNRGLSKLSQVSGREH
jgi:hypothetical protein